MITSLAEHIPLQKNSRRSHKFLYNIYIENFSINIFQDIYPLTPCLDQILARNKTCL